MDPLRSVKARLGAARLMLAAQNGKPHHTSVSRVQADALIATISEHRFDATIRADLVTLAIEIKWTSADLQRVLGALEGAVRETKRRRAGQEYSNFPAYLTDEVWEQLLGTELSAHSKLQILISRLVLLGLRCPTEHTTKLISSAWLMVSEPSGRLAFRLPSRIAQGYLSVDCGGCTAAVFCTWKQHRKPRPNTMFDSKAILFVSHIRVAELHWRHGR